MKEEEESIEKKINELFENPHFRLKLNEFIAEELTFRADRDSHTGQTDNLEVRIGDHYIPIQSKSYGY